MSVNSLKKFTQTKGLTDLNFRVNIKGHCNRRKQIFGHKLNNSYGNWDNIIQTAKVVFSDLVCIQYARDMHLFFFCIFDSLN